MGAGASSLPRVRKALLIRAHNMRAADQTLIDQFLPFAFRGPDHQMHILPSQIQNCLNMNKTDYFWLEDLLKTLFTPSDPLLASSSSSGKGEKALKLFDFIHFLETGKLPVITAAQDASSPMPEASRKLPAIKKDRPPHPPVQPTGPLPAPASPSLAHLHADGTGASPNSSPQHSPQPKHDEVMAIDLGNMSARSLPSSVKLKADSIVSSNHEDKECLEIAVISNSAKQQPQDKQVWRKREVMRQERTVHYTTVDELGTLQELVEKEVTQTEVLHMESRITGEFAHRESTQYEQMETFNDEIVNEVTGNEEYVHLKSLEDEFHYMDSTMPPKQAASSAPPPSEDKPPASPDSTHANPDYCPEGVEQEFGDPVDAPDFPLEEPVMGQMEAEGRPPLYPGGTQHQARDDDEVVEQYVDITQEEPALTEQNLAFFGMTGESQVDPEKASLTQNSSYVSLHEID